MMGGTTLFAVKPPMKPDRSSLSVTWLSTRIGFRHCVTLYLPSDASIAGTVPVNLPEPCLFSGGAVRCPADVAVAD